MVEDKQTALQSLKEQLKISKTAQLEGQEPLQDGYTRLTFEEIDKNFMALTALSQRRIPEGKSEKKVKRLIQFYYSEAHKFFKDLHHLIIKNHPVPENWEDDQSIPIVIAERRQHLFEELKRDTFDIQTVPEHLLLTSDDMPIASIKGELGHQNRFGVADIKVKLGYLYSEPEDDDKKEV
jgi:hypothetical protein